ncbi:MAG TPA: GNAT family N-acetyltransferase [Kofleriaceae bacterium]|nr:GNAT family N-acetyltransferase [Kofleriaceae bacterium]
MIRRATVADHTWIADVAADVYGDLGDYGSIIRSWLAHPGVLTYLDEVREHGRRGDIFRGFTLLGFYEPSAGQSGPYVADLLAIAVSRAHQRKGVGTRLLEHAIHLAGLAADGRRAMEMRLTVADTNQVGRRFFASFGFRVLDEDHGHYDGGQRAIRMVRDLP